MQPLYLMQPLYNLPSREQVEKLFEEECRYSKVDIYVARWRCPWPGYKTVPVGWRVDVHPPAFHPSPFSNQRRTYHYFVVSKARVKLEIGPLAAKDAFHEVCSMELFALAAKAAL